jgi:hypothetical protein
MIVVDFVVEGFLVEGFLVGLDQSYSIIIEINNFLYI